MKHILVGLGLILLATPSHAEDFQTVVRRCNSPLYDTNLMRACGMLATQAQLDPINRAVAYDLRARAYLALGQFDYSILDTTQALALLDKPSSVKANDPTMVRTHAYAIRSAAFAKTGQPDKAVADRNTALALTAETVAHKSEGAGQMEVAFVKHILGDDAEALEAASKAVALAPTSPGTHSMRAEIYEALGNREAAIQDYRAALTNAAQVSDKFQHDKLVLAAQLGLQRLAATP